MPRPAPRLVVLAALGTVTAAALTGCGAGGTAADGKPSPRPAPRGAVTPEEAKRIADHYEQVNNKANATRDEKLLSTVEDGQLHAHSTSDYTLFKTWSKKDQQEYGKPFTYVDREYYIPAGQGWFAMKAKTSDSGSQGLFVFDRVGGAWKMVLAVYTDAPIPAIATDGHGLATAVTPATRVGSLAPKDVSAAFEDLYATGGKKQGAALSPTTDPVKTALKIYKERDAGENGSMMTNTYVATPAVRDTVYALRLKSGGALVLLPTAHQQRKILKPAYLLSYKITPSKDEAVYNPAARVAVVDIHQGMALATLPPTGKATVLGGEYRMTDSQ